MLYCLYNPDNEQFLCYAITSDNDIYNSTRWYWDDYGPEYYKWKRWSGMYFIEDKYLYENGVWLSEMISSMGVFDKVIDGKIMAVRWEGPQYQDELNNVGAPDFTETFPAVQYLIGKEITWHKDGDAYKDIIGRGLK